jgi:DNA-binding Lrp family transcriptional regulator
MVSVEQRLHQMGRLVYALDETNIRIIKMMHKVGPRNLLEVARATELPPTSVYDRARRLEHEFGVLSTANLEHSKIGLRKCATLVESSPGMEEYVTEALAVPNYWKTITRCEGGFTHYALHAIPAQRRQEFEKYLDQIQEGGLARKHETIWVSDYHYLFPNFQLYDPRYRAWSFEWDTWMSRVKERRDTKVITDPVDYSIRADRTDLLILAALEINAREKFSEMSKLLGITLQAVKHRYDKRIVPRGLIKDFIINVFPYPPGISDLYEVLMTFDDDESMQAFCGTAQQMFPVQRIMKVLGKRILSVRAYTPRSETKDLFSTLSNLARSGLLSDYSAVRIRPEMQTRQMISTELFDDKVGWKYEASQHSSVLETITEHAKVNV